MSSVERLKYLLKKFYSFTQIASTEESIIRHRKNKTCNQLIAFDFRLKEQLHNGMHSVFVVSLDVCMSCVIFYEQTTCSLLRTSIPLLVTNTTYLDALMALPADFNLRPQVSPCLR